MIFMHYRIKFMGVVVLFAMFIIAISSRNVSAVQQTPQSAATVPSVIEKDGKQIEINEKKDKVTVQSFFDVSWSNPMKEGGINPANSTNVTLQDLSYNYNQTVDMNQDGDTTLIANGSEVLTYGLESENNSFINVNMIYFTANASANEYAITYGPFANLASLMTNGSFFYIYTTSPAPPLSSFLLIERCLDADGIVQGLHIHDHNAGEGSDIDIILWQNNTAQSGANFYDPISNVNFGGVYFLYVGFGIITFTSPIFTISLAVESGSATITLKTETAPFIRNTIFVMSLSNLWQWIFGTLRVETKTMVGSMYMTYYNAWLIDHYGLMYVYIFDVYDIKIECFWYNYIYTVFNWYWITLVWWYWDCSIYWEAKIVIEDWIIEWTLFWDIALMQWNWWFWIYYCCWELPFVMFQVPLVTIEPIVKVDVVEEVYDATTDKMNLTYRLTDIYGKNVENAEVDVKVDNDTVRASALGNGLYKVTHNETAKADAWTITVNATVPQVALVQHLDYTLDIDEVTCASCEECEECQECAEVTPWNTTTYALLGTTITGFGVAGLIARFGRKSSWICPPA